VLHRQLTSYEDLDRRSNHHSAEPVVDVGTGGSVKEQAANDVPQLLVLARQLGGKQVVVGGYYDLLHSVSRLPRYGA
jgi:hypothetical protein